MQLPWNKKESELDREVRYHLDALAADFERQGLLPEEARRRARIEFSGPEQVKEKCREQSPWRWFTGLRQDIAFGGRMLRKTPVVTVAAVLSLALGIGSNTAIFSLMDAVLWKTIAVPEPKQMSLILWTSAARAEGMFRGRAGSSYPENGLRVSDFFAYPAFQTMREKSAGKAEIGGFVFPFEASASYRGSTAVASQRGVSGNFFEVLGLNGFAGRLIQPEDDSARAAETVAVSYRFWKKTLHGETSAIGQTLRINNKPHRIVGILPEDFYGLTVGDPTDLYVSFHHWPELKAWSERNNVFGDSQFWWVQLIARRAPGVSAESYQTFLDSVFHSTWATTPPKDPKSNPRIRIDEGSQGLGTLRREFRQPLYVLFALVGMVLLVACANIANLLLARADARKKEVALRISVGCSRGRLVRQLLTESALLAALGGIASIAFAYITANLLVAVVPSRGPANIRLDIELNLQLILATLAITTLAVVLFGVFPAWRTTRLDLTTAMKEGAGSTGTAGHTWWTPGKFLVVAQVAFAVLLVVAAAVFVRNLQRITNLDAGFERAGLVLFDLRPGEGGYSGERLHRFYIDLERRLGDVPGVQSVGFSRYRPMAGYGEFSPVFRVGTTTAIDSSISRITAHQLPTMGIRVLAGRGFERQDFLSNPTTVLVSEDLAQKIDSERSPVGAKIYVNDDPEGPVYEVVGVVANVAYSRLTERTNVLYFPNSLSDSSAAVTLRTVGPPLRVLPAVREAIKELDKDLPIVDPLTMEQQIAEGLKRERLFAYLCGGFGTLALVLSAVGLYGVVSYSAARRRGEIGIRMALGATQGDVVRLVLREGLLLVGLGFVLGAPAVVYCSRFVGEELYEMKPLDAPSLATALSVLLAAAFFASLIPALRASWSDPTAALRQE
ncbi:MAG: ABC transporter permease [Bryobacteraceae bacterium]